MVIDLAKNPRVAQLLGRIEEQRRTLRALKDGDEARRGVEAAIAEAYVEVGRYVHWLLGQDPVALARVEAEGARWAAQMQESLELVPLPEIATDEIIIEEIIDDDESTGFSDTNLPFAEMTPNAEVGTLDVRELPQVPAGGLGAVDRLGNEPTAPEAAPPETEVLPLQFTAELDPELAFGYGASDPDASDSLPPVMLEAEEPQAPPAPAVAEDGEEDSMTDAEPLAVGGDDQIADTLHFDEADESDGNLRGLSIAVTTGAFEVPSPSPASLEERDPSEATGTFESDWLGALSELLIMLGEPADLPSDDVAMQSAVRVLVVSTSNLEVRWSRFPSAIGQALLGHVGARAQRLLENDAENTDVRLAISRMRRYAQERSLLLPPSLREGVLSKRDWAREELRYWQVLHAGM